MELTPFFIGGALVATGLIFCAHWAPKNVDFIITACIAGTFFYNHIIPYFDPSMRIFGVVADIVVSIGALVGGVFDLLLPKVSVGISGGVLLSLFISTVMLMLHSHEPANIFAKITLVFVIVIIASIFMAQKFESLMCHFRLSLAVGLLMAVSIDGIFNFGLAFALSDILRMKITSIDGPCEALSQHIASKYHGSNYHCHIGSMAFLWAIISFFTFFMQAHMSGLYRKWRSIPVDQATKNLVMKATQYRGSENGSGNNVNSSEKGSGTNATHDFDKQNREYMAAKAIKRSQQFNYFDWKNLPIEMEILGNPILDWHRKFNSIFGFQSDNLRNQSEHLLMLLHNELKPSDGNSYVGPAERLHKRLFFNYRNWVHRMDVNSHLTKNKLADKEDFTDLNRNDKTISQSSSIVQSGKLSGFIRDLLLYLLIWGESANLRHMPECMCFILHKSLEYCNIKSQNRDFHDMKDSVGSSQNNNMTYLETVVSPIYNVIVNGMKKGKDHIEKKTYDDYNEFFWSPLCLQYNIYLLGSEEANGSLNKNLALVEGLKKCKKTYLEKRSWLHPILSLRRILEWHIVTFTLLTSYAFASHLKWNVMFSWQVASVIFLVISLLNMLWICLEIWVLFPDTHMSGSTLSGYFIRLISGYLALIYQAIYFHWSFREDVSDSGDASMRSQGNPMFWWWQYIWLSVIFSFFYFVESIICFFPSIVSFVMTIENEFVQALLNVCYPLSQQFVGKKVHVPQKEVWSYVFYWITLISFKLWFSYTFIILPVVAPSLELFDDYMNFDNLSFFKFLTLLFIWWLPHFLVYLIDLSIFYSVWSSIFGGFIALFERQGAVRDMKSLKTYFIRAPLAFVQKIMPETSVINQKSSGLAASTAVLDQLLLQSDVNATSSLSSYQSRGKTHGVDFDDMNEESKLLGNNNNNNNSNSNHNYSYNSSSAPKSVPRAVSSADFMTLQHQPHSTAHSHNQNTSTFQDFTHTVSGVLDVRSMRWVIFAKVWNEVITRLRDNDYLSDFEKEVFSFTSFEMLLKPVYLPLFITAGCIESTIFEFQTSMKEFHSENEPEKKISVTEKFHASLDTSMKEAIHESYELLRFILIQVLGSPHTQDVEAICTLFYNWCSDDNIFVKINGDSVTSIFNNVSVLVSTLKNAMPKRKKKPVIDENEKEFGGLKVEVGSIMKNITSNLHSSNNNSVSSGNSAALSRTSSNMKKSMSTGFLMGLNGDSVDFSLGSTSRGNTPSIATTPSNTSTTTTTTTNNNSNNNTTNNMTESSVPALTPVTPGGGIRDPIRDKIREELRTFFNNLCNAMRSKNSGASGHSVTPDAMDAINRVTFLLKFEHGFFWSDYHASNRLDELAKYDKFNLAVNKLNGLLKLRQAEIEPASSEAKRRLYFFINSLFMELPSTTNVKYCKEFTCMTPFYSEDVLLTRDDLQSKNSDGISTMLYLQTLYKNEWKNFLERRKIVIDDDVNIIWSSEHIYETRMWSSLRAQTLFRTVEGMMYQEKAIQLFYALESMQNSNSSFYHLNHAVNTNPREIEVLSKLKFQYVVACQVYGAMKKNMEHKAEDIEFLLNRHKNLRVAYIDSLRANREGDMYYYSVLIKADESEPTSSMKPGVTEVYRIRLPGNPVLGEGKPENQNHAIVFSRGRYLQAIDMNQDFYFEEALKTRNLLQEFDAGHDILGFREHIFTGSVSSVANYMALQELSFVTLGQRVLYNPLRIRQHYGHPDLFDKFFVMTEGGMSKASKGINLSEDVFAGFNATIRGKSVGFREYIQVGKGRDVGLQQTYKFEAKLSQGNAEQSISRDLSRICDRLDFFRLMSFYYGGIGHYISNTMVMVALVIVVYTMVGLAVFHEEGVNGRPLESEGIIQIMLSGLGIVQTLPLAVTLTVEKGVLAALGEILYMIISGGPLYFIFHIQTKCFYFQQTLLAGNAIYRPTGRGFVIRHSPFDENYRFFACSHIYLGFEIMVALIIFGLFTTSKQMTGLTWSLWMTCVAFLMGPFWFNPVTFEWNKVTEDYFSWLKWMTEGSGTAEQSWLSWWKEENSFYKHLSLSWKLWLCVQKCCLWMTLGIGLFGSSFFNSQAKTERFLEIVLLYGFLFLGQYCLSLVERSWSYALRRFSSLLLSAIVTIVTVYLFVTKMVLIRHAVGMYYIISSVAFVALISGFEGVISLYKIHDYIVGHFLFAVLFIVTLLQLGYLQTWLLYHNALSSGVVIDDILKYARKSQERAFDEKNTIATLRQQVDEQANLIRTLLQQATSTGSSSIGHKSHSISSSVNFSSLDENDMIPTTDATPLMGFKSNAADYGSMKSSNVQQTSQQQNVHTSNVQFKEKKLSLLKPEIALQSVQTQPQNRVHFSELPK